MTADDPINVGDFIYTRGTPIECIGHRYRVMDPNVLLVPVNQYVVLVEAMTWPHRGLRFVCSRSNFISRYEPAPVESAEPVPEKVAGAPSTGSGV